MSDWVAIFFVLGIFYVCAVFVFIAYALLVTALDGVARLWLRVRRPQRPAPATRRHTQGHAPGRVIRDADEALSIWSIRRRPFDWERDGA